MRLLEKMNEEQKALIDDLKNRNAVDSDMPSRDNIIAELDFLGAPYIAISQDSTLLYVLHEFKAALRDKALGKLMLLVFTKFGVADGC